MLKGSNKLRIREHPEPVDIMDDVNEREIQNSMSDNDLNKLIKDTGYVEIDEKTVEK